MLCTNGHSNPDTNEVCSRCGVDTFQATPVVSTSMPAAPPIYVQATNVGKVSGFAIASLVLGIVWIYGITSVLAIIFAILARKQVANEGRTGGGMAIAGLVLGIIGVVGAIIVFISLAVAVNHIQHMTGFTGFSG